MLRLETNTHKSEEGISPMTIGTKTYTDRAEAGAALLEACKSVTTTQPVKIGSYRGFDMVVSFDSMNKRFECGMKGSMTHTAELGTDSFGNITRINNAFDKIPQRLMSVETQLQTLFEQAGNAKAELEKPFQFGRELADKSERLAALDALLNVDDNGTAESQDEQGRDGEEPEIGTETGKTDAVAAKAVQTYKEPSAEVNAKRKPPLLETLEKNAEKSRALFGSGELRKRDVVI